MDPTAALAAVICRLLDASRSHHKENQACFLEEADWSYEGLKEWLTNGGFAPDGREACKRVLAYIDAQRKSDPRQAELF